MIVKLYEREGSVVVAVSSQAPDRELTRLEEIAAFTRESGGKLGPASARRLGVAAAVLASLDPSIRLPNEVHSLGKVVDAYDSQPGCPTKVEHSPGEWTPYSESWNRSAAGQTQTRYGSS